MAGVSLNVSIEEESRAELERLAAVLQRDRDSLIGEAVEKFLELQRHQIEKIEAGLRQADAGEFVDPEEVSAVFARI